MPAAERAQKFHTADVSLPHLGSVSDWFKQISSTHDQSERVIPRTLFRSETNGGVAKCRLFPQAKTAAI